MTLFEALIIQFKFAIIMIIATILWSKIQNKTVKEFMMLDTYARDDVLILSGILFVLWFGVATILRYVYQLPLMGVWGYFI